MGFMYRNYTVNTIVEKNELIKGSSIFDMATNNWDNLLLVKLKWKTANTYAFLRYKTHSAKCKVIWDIAIASLDIYYFKPLGIMKAGTLTNSIHKLRLQRLNADGKNEERFAPEIAKYSKFFYSEDWFNRMLYGKERDSHNTGKGNNKKELLQDPLAHNNPTKVTTYYPYTIDISYSKYTLLDGLFIQALEGLIHDEDIAVALNEGHCVRCYGGSGWKNGKDIDKGSFYSDTDNGKDWATLFDNNEFHFISKSLPGKDFNSSIVCSDFYNDEYLSNLLDLAKALSHKIIQAMDPTNVKDSKNKSITNWKKVINGVRYDYTSEDGLFITDTSQPNPQGTISYVDILKNIKKDNLKKWTNNLTSISSNVCYPGLRLGEINSAKPDLNPLFNETPQKIDYILNVNNSIVEPSKLQILKNTFT